MSNNRQHEVKSWLYALIGVVAGATAAYFWLDEGEAVQQSEPHEISQSNDQAAQNMTLASTSTQARGMLPDEAYNYFINYQGTDSLSPQGLLQTEEGTGSTAALGIYLDKADLFEQLENAAANQVQQKTLTGYYAIFAEENERQHRLLLMGVYEDGNGDKRLMLPVDDEDASCIYDWIQPCPGNCPTESAGGSFWVPQNWHQ